VKTTAGQLGNISVVRHEPQNITDTCME